MKKVHTIQEFIDKGDQIFTGKHFDSGFVSQLMNDFGVPKDLVEFGGCIENEYNLWNEYMILYKFSKKNHTLGECLKTLGKIISRLENCVNYDFGIQEIDTSRPDNYYILFYGLSGKKEE